MDMRGHDVMMELASGDWVRREDLHQKLVWDRLKPKPIANFWPKPGAWFLSLCARIALVFSSPAHEIRSLDISLRNLDGYVMCSSHPEHPDNADLDSFRLTAIGRSWIEIHTGKFFPDGCLVDGSL